MVELLDKVFIGGKKTPFLVAAVGELSGEAAVGLCRSSDGKALRDWAKRRHHRNGSRAPVQVVYWVAVADLVRDPLRRGWRERWRQLSLELGERENAVGQ